MKKITPLLSIILLAGCLKAVKPDVEASKECPSEPVATCSGYGAAFTKAASNCSRDLFLCQAENNQWRRQCASYSAELDACENPK